MLIAHPPEELARLGLLPVGLALLGALLVVSLGAVLPIPRSVTVEADEAEAGVRPTPTRLPLFRRRTDTPIESWADGLSAGQVATRTVAVAALFFVVAAARIGDTSQLENIAPALVIGVAWPLLLLGSAILGPVWRWLDPWDGLARVVESEKDETGASDERARAGGNVWPAVVPALAWVWYLSAYTGALDPRPLGAALASYSLFMLAACLAFGRQLWLARTEIFGLVFSWTARLPRGQLVSWRPPPGSEVVLGVLASGFLFGRLRFTTWWSELTIGPLFNLYSAAGVFVCATLGGALLWLLARRSAEDGAPGAVAVAAVPAVISVALAISMASNRLFTSLQLLPRLVGDPFGFGWDPFGTADWILITEPFGHLGLKVVQMIVLLAGHVVGAAVLARRVEQPARPAALVALAVLFIPSLIAIAGTP
ncbi:MAG TPA: hypothetical protein VHH54_05085 [Actinomycetota bacterium]|nr:hypothetical protein [Actinomycetota bacterium]